jgi:hypothetical protein
MTPAEFKAHFKRINEMHDNVASYLPDVFRETLVEAVEKFGAPAHIVDRVQEYVDERIVPPLFVIAEWIGHDDCGDALRSA